MSGKCGYERQAEQLATARTARTARVGFAELLSYRHWPGRVNIREFFRTLKD